MVNISIGNVVIDPSERDALYENWKAREEEPDDTEYLLPSGILEGYQPGAGRINIGGIQIAGPGGSIYLPTFGSADSFPIQQTGYRTGAGALLWDAYSVNTRARLTQDMVDMGLIDKGYLKDGLAGGTSIDQHNAWDQILGVANYYGITPFAAVRRLKDLAEAGVIGPSGGSGRGAAAGIIMEIPDYETAAQRSKDMFRQMLGRTPEDWELTLVADEMHSAYRTAAELQTQARLAGNGIFEIPDPLETTKSYVEEEYGNELDRLGDIASTGDSNALMLQAATMGAKMVGG